MLVIAITKYRHLTLALVISIRSYIPIIDFPKIHFNIILPPFMSLSSE
jgi:hypothetical protein